MEFDKSNINLRLSENDKEEINEFISKSDNDFFDTTKGDFKVKELFLEILHTANTRKKASNPADLKKIEELEKQIAGKHIEFDALQSEIINLKATHENDLKIWKEKVNAAIQQANENGTLVQKYDFENTDLKNQLEIACNEKRSLSETVKAKDLKENQIIVSLTQIQKEALIIYARSIKFAAWSASVNKNGKFNGLVDLVGTDERQNMGTVLTNIFINRILNGVPTPEIIESEKLMQRFQQIKKNENAGN